MFEKWFAKYARAVSDKNERNWLFKKYKTLAVITIIFICLCVVFIASVLIFEPYLENDIAVIALIFLMLATLGLGIATLCLWLSFRKAYNAILKRPAYMGEMPEVSAYRQKTVQNKKSTFKSLWWAWLVFAIGVIGFIVCMAMEFVKNPDSDDFSVWGSASFWCLLIGSLTLALSYVFYYTFKQQQGKAIEQQTSAEAAAIDAAQGRKSEYNLQSDPNLNTYKYIFPDKELYEKAEKLRIEYSKFTTIGIIAAIVVTAIVIISLYAANVLNTSNAGYAMPMALSILFVVMILFILLPRQRRELNALEKQQKAELVSNPDYAKNYEWYKLYEDFNKFKGKIILIFYIAGVALGWVLGAIYPATIWSLTSLVVIFIGLIINNALVKQLRLKAQPIELEIDELQKEQEKQDI